MGWLPGILKWDQETSYAVYTWYREKIRSTLPCKLLEASGHGVLWYSVVIGLFFGVRDAKPWFYVLLMNIFCGLSLDLVVICILKPVFARKRPVYNEGKLVLTLAAVDKHSFPSGHATRSAMVAMLVMFGNTMYGKPSLPFAWACVLWAITVMESRVMIGRHHVLDVAVGAVVGVLNALVVVHCGRVNSRSALALRELVLGWLRK